MPRFVILRHELPPESPRESHFDLMFERDGVLRAWACERLPEIGEFAQAEQLAEHRLAYLDYEGPVAGDRGSVSRVAAGTYELIEETADLLRVRLVGDSIAGVLTMARLPGEAQKCRVSRSAG